MSMGCPEFLEPYNGPKSKQPAAGFQIGPAADLFSWFLEDEAVDAQGAGIN